MRCDHSIAQHSSTRVRYRVRILGLVIEIVRSRGFEFSPILPSHCMRLYPSLMIQRDQSSQNEKKTKQQRARRSSRVKCRSKKIAENVEDVSSKIKWMLRVLTVDVGLAGRAPRCSLHQMVGDSPKVLRHGSDCLSRPKPPWLRREKSWMGKFRYRVKL